MIRSTELTLYRGTKLLLENTDFVVHPGERVGLIGRNGCGKTSLMAALCGQLEPDQGSLNITPDWRLAWVEQSIQDMDRPAREHVIDGDRKLRQLQTQRAQTTDPHEIAQLELQLEEAGAWQANSRAESFLSGLGFAPDTWLNPVGTFSGGWQMRLNLAQALMAASDLLLLDEPTNHLDLDATLWLERWLASYQGTVILISHDVEFLDAICNVILHIEQRSITRYRGNYESFLRQHTEKARQSELAFVRQSRETERLQQFIDRFKAKASKAKQAQSRVKALGRMQTLAPAKGEAAIEIHIPTPAHSPNILLRLDDIDAGYQGNEGQEHCVLKDINLMVQAQDRIGVLGVNGAGKSTLMKIMANEMAPLRGQRTEGQGLKIGYFAQQQMTQLDAQASPLQHMARIAPEAREQELRSHLGQFGFTGDKALALVGPFSGGEKSRLALSLILWQRPNLLILDEPTNHLDIETRHALTVALAQSEAGLLLVSHDRHLLRTTVDQFWLVADGTVQVFDGDLDDYRQRSLQRTPSKEKNDQNLIPNSLQDRREQRRAQAQQRKLLAVQRRPLERELAQVEKALQAAQTRLEELQTLIQDPAFYEDSRSEERQTALKEHGLLSAREQEIETEWFELMQKLEQLEKDLLGTDQDS